ncbi:alpha-glucosidase [Trifolium repens]|nr:alpha-glucosidase [Trifolium repens]
MANYEGQVISGSSDVRKGNMIFEAILDDGVFRFDCSVDDREAAYPSISFVNSKDRDTPITSTHKVPSYTPTFECLLEQQVVQLELPIGTSLYGTGEVSGQLERTGKRVFTWNTDAWGYDPGTSSLYQSHPWVLAVLPNGEALGILADTTRRCEIDLRKESTIRFVAPSSYPVITFGPFASPTEVLISLSKAIGTVFMPAKWSLGYQQCRWSYLSAQRVLEVAKEFREKGIPCDVIWMDIDYMDGFRCFTFDKESFRDPKSLTEDLHYSGFKGIWMLDPGIKQEKGYFAYDSGSENDVWVQKADRTPFVGDVWPGPCVFPDYTQSKVRAWWANLVKDFVSNGVDGIWNDMNEPAVFKSVTKTMPESNVHRGDGELGGCQNHSFYHNVYGLLMARSTYEGMKLANENKRPFVLTRAGFIGSQRYAATWTGDNLSTWEHLHMSISMVLQLGLSGQPLSGPDIGGFAGNATPRLFGRWMGVALTMNPGPLGKSTTCNQGLDKLEITLPKGIWLGFDFSDAHPDLPGLYLKGGSIIPVGLPLQHVGEANPSDELTLLVALDESGKAEGFLFEDDGDGYEFTKGNYLLTHYVAELQSSIVTVSVHKTEGSWKRPKRRLHIQVLLGGGAKLDAWGVDGEVLHINWPSEEEASKLVSTSEKQYKERLEKAIQIPDVEDEVSGPKGMDLSRTPIELKSTEWLLKVVPWIGGRIISMRHFPSGTQWLHGRIEISGYEEYSGTEYRSAGCSEEYSIINRELGHAGEEESVVLEGDIGGGLVLQRKIYFPKNATNIIQINSSITARSVGPGSGGFSRLVCLRIHPTFHLLHPSESLVSFTSIDGSTHEVFPDGGEKIFEGRLIPNGEWRLVDKYLGLALVNRFNATEVLKCLVHWDFGTVNLELWSDSRPVSEQSPIRISHQYEVIRIR